MATYLRPGVFVEETLTPLVDPNSDTSDSLAAFVGVSRKGGPLGPTLITSWAQYLAMFGDLRGATDELGFAVFSFFNNGGSQCYVVRAVNENATEASLTLKDPDADTDGTDTAEDALIVTATSPGAWATSAAGQPGIYVSVIRGSNDRFDLTVEVGSAPNQVARETFVDLTLDPADYRNALAIVNSETIGSKYVRLSLPGSGSFGSDTDPSTYGNPAAVDRAPLTGGTDGTGSPSLTNAVERLDQVDQILLVNLPGVTDTTILTSVITWAESAQNRFVIVDIPRPTSPAPDVVASAALSMADALPPSSYAAVYGPWLYTQDPSTSASGAVRLSPPGGAVLGQYARNDVLRGVSKVPAGTSTNVKAVNAQVRFVGTQLDSLNQSAVNVIRLVPGNGLCIMGGRTLATGTPDRYISIRRTLIFLKRSLSNLSRFAIFQPNEPGTWETIEAVLDQFLRAFWQSGALFGNVPEQAFFVTCDETNNSAADIAAGVVNIDVGVALETPAEFIVIRIGQYESGSIVTTDSAEATL